LHKGATAAAGLLIGKSLSGTTRLAGGFRKNSSFVGVLYTKTNGSRTASLCFQLIGKFTTQKKHKETFSLCFYTAAALKLSRQRRPSLLRKSVNSPLEKANSYFRQRTG